MSGPSKTSGILSASALVAGRGNNKGPVILAGAHIVTNGTDDVTVTLYDSLAATGPEVFKQVVAGSDLSIPFVLPQGGISCGTGLYAVIAGAGAELIVHFR